MLSNATDIAEQLYCLETSIVYTGYRKKKMLEFGESCSLHMYSAQIYNNYRYEDDISDEHHLKEASIKSKKKASSGRLPRRKLVYQ